MQWIPTNLPQLRTRAIFSCTYSTDEQNARDDGVVAKRALLKRTLETNSTADCIILT